MPIPSMESGYLPPGIHNCEIDDIRADFGWNGRRMELVDGLDQYVTKLQDTGFNGHLIIDGSFVTAENEPGDIDVILVADLTSWVSMDYFTSLWILSEDHVKEEFSVHQFSAIEGDETVEHLTALFSGTREDPDITKGMLRVRI